jgi:GNAT superfamily N-acetyltransferase
VDVLVREATLDDAQLIADLTRAAWADRVSVTSAGHRETRVTVLPQLQTGGGFILLVHGEPAGSVRWMPLDDEPDVWEIMRMGVLSPYRGRNLSAYLLEAVIDAALEHGAIELRLAVRADQSRLVDFYAAFGFEVAPELEYSHANPLAAPPTVLRRRFDD